VTSTSSNSSSSLSRSNFESISNALDVEETGKDTAQTKKNSTTNGRIRKKLLLTHEQWERKHALKIWDEIV